MKWTERELLERTAWMRRLARGLTRDESRADDLVQEAWVRALEAREPLRSPAAWLRTVLGRRHSSEQRTRGRRADRERAAARGEAQPPADDALQRIELQERLARAVFALDEPCKRVIALRYFQGWPPRRIAAELDLDVRSVEARLRRGLEALRRKLDTEHDGRREDWLGGVAALGGPGLWTWKPLAAAASSVVIVGVAVSAAVTADEASAGSGTRAPLPAPVQVAVGDGAPRATPARATPAMVVPDGRAQPSDPVDEDVATSGFTVTLVRAGDGLPVSGARVRAEGFELVADAAGEVELPGRTRALRVSETDHTRIAEFKLEGPEPRTLELPRRGGTLLGQVLDLQGQPVARAEVRCFVEFDNRTFKWEAPSHTTVADRLGRFELTDLANERGGSRSLRLLAATRDGFSPVLTTGKLSGGDVRETVLVIQPSGILRGHVAAWDQSHVAGSPVDVYARSDDGFEAAAELFGRQGRGRNLWGRVERYPAFALETDAQGRFQQQLPGAVWHVAVNDQAYAAWYTWTEPGEFVDVLLEGGATLNGRVVDAKGRPVPGASVEFWGREQRTTAQTDPDGRFSFRGLSPIEGVLLPVRAEGHACGVEIVDLAPGTNEVEVQLEPEFVVRGQLVDRRGQPLQGKLVHVVGERIAGSAHWPRHRGTSWYELAGAPARSFTDANGGFEMRGLVPGPHTLRMGVNWTSETTAAVPEDGGPFVVVEGDRTDSADLRGAVLWSDGAAPGEVVVWLQRFVDGEREPVLGQIAGQYAHGSYEFRGLLPGRYRLHARVQGGTASYRGELLELGPGITSFDVVLTPAD